MDCAILRGYRRACALTQQQLADMLGYDRTYISMIESGHRTITGRGTLVHIARTLAIPPHVLGIAGPDDADFAAMLAFGTSVIRLTRIARHSGRAAVAVSELWPLITRLEARVTAGYAEPENRRPPRYVILVDTPQSHRSHLKADGLVVTSPMGTFVAERPRQP